MYALEHLGFAIMKRFLASSMVLSVSLMSSAVSSCEISCLYDEDHCGDALVHNSSNDMGGRPQSLKTDETIKPSQGAMQAGIRSDTDVICMQTDSACNDELCKNVSTAAVLPNRTQLKGVLCVAVPVITSAKLPTGHCSMHKTESPPPKFARLNILSVTLRI